MGIVNGLDACFHNADTSFYGFFLVFMIFIFAFVLPLLSFFIICPSLLLHEITFLERPIVRLGFERFAIVFMEHEGVKSVRSP